MPDPTAEILRLNRLTDINSSPKNRAQLEAEHGQVWDTNQLAEDFDVIAFLAPFVVVIRQSDGQKGSLEFQHDPRFFFNFQPHKE